MPNAAHGLSERQSVGVFCSVWYFCFIEQAAEEFLAVMKLYHQTYGQSSWLTNWDDLDTHSIIDSRDGGITGNSAYDYIATGVNLVLDHPEYFHNYHMWLYEWDDSQPWLVDGEGTMQTLLVPVPEPDEDDEEPVTLRSLRSFLLFFLHRIFFYLQPASPCSFG